MALLVLIVVAIAILANRGSDDSEIVAAPSATTSEKFTTTTLEITEPPTTEPTTEPPSTTPPIGTRENPVPAGTTAPAGDWDITITGYEPGIDAQAFNQFNDAAPAGSEYVRVMVKATYTGEGTGGGFDLSLNLVDSTATTYDPASVADGSGGDPQDFRDQPETFKGGTIEGYFYYVVPSAQANAKLLVFPPRTRYSDVPGGVGFFAVN